MLALVVIVRPGTGGCDAGSQTGPFGFSCRRSLCRLSPTPLCPFPIPHDTDEAFLNRLTFGANAADRAHLAKLGRARWLTNNSRSPLTPLSTAG